MKSPKTSANTPLNKASPSKKPLKHGMEAKSKEFMENGAEVYAKV
jgi:hypothetical protein